MRAYGENERHTVYVSVDDDDFALSEDVASSLSVLNGSKYDELAGLDAKDVLVYTGDLDYVDIKDMGWTNSDQLTVSVEVSIKRGANWEVLDSSTAESVYGQFTQVGGTELDADYRVVYSVVIDYLKDGEPTTDHSGDNVDDRKQTVYSFEVQGWDEGKEAATNEYDEYEFVADKKSTLEYIIENKIASKYASSYVVDDVVYQLVFYVNGTTVTAKWEKEPTKQIVYGKASSDVVYDELDTNHDGVVSCDEAHGEGWVWNEDKKACVYTGSTTSTVIVNTATK